jgi:hypothetical protein
VNNVIPFRNSVTIQGDREFTFAVCTVRNFISTEAAERFFISVNPGMKNRKISER